MNKIKLFLVNLLIYLQDNFIAIDQLFNTLLLGKPDETLSSRAYRADKQNKLFGKIFRPLIDGIFFWQKEHCYQAYISEKKRKQLPLHFSTLN